MLSPSEALLWIEGTNDIFITCSSIMNRDGMCKYTTLVWRAIMHADEPLWKLLALHFGLVHWDVINNEASDKSFDECVRFQFKSLISSVRYFVQSYCVRT